MAEHVRHLLESLYLEDTLRITSPNLIQINDFFCYYDKSLSIEFKNFLFSQKNHDFLLKSRKFLIIFRLLKKFMKKVEIREIKQIFHSILDPEFDKYFISSINPNAKKKKTKKPVNSRALNWLILFPPQGSIVSIPFAVKCALSSFRFSASIS